MKLYLQKGLTNKFMVEKFPRVSHINRIVVRTKWQSSRINGNVIPGLLKGNRSLVTECKDWRNST